MSLVEVRFDSAQRDFHTEKDAVTLLVLKAKTDHFNAQVPERQTCEQLLSVTNSLPGKFKVNPLPTNITAAQLPHSFWECFTKRSNKLGKTMTTSPLLTF